MSVWNLLYIFDRMVHKLIESEIVAYVSLVVLLVIVYLLCAGVVNR